MGDPDHRRRERRRASSARATRADRVAQSSRPASARAPRSAAGTVTLQDSSGFTANVTVTASGALDVDPARRADDEDGDALERLPGERRLAGDAERRRTTSARAPRPAPTSPPSRPTSRSRSARRPASRRSSNGSTVVITRTAGGDFTVTLSVSPADSMTIATTATRFVTYDKATTGDVTVAGTSFSSGTAGGRRARRLGARDRDQRLRRSPSPPLPTPTKLVRHRAERDDLHAHGDRTAPSTRTRSRARRRPSAARRSPATRGGSRSPHRRGRHRRRRR